MWFVKYANSSAFCLLNSSNSSGGSVYILANISSYFGHAIFCAMSWKRQTNWNCSNRKRFSNSNYVISISRHWINWNGLPPDRKRIQSFLRWHETGQKTLRTHYASFGIAALHLYNIFRVIAVGWHKTIVSGSQIRSRIEHLARAFQWKCTRTATPFVIFVWIIWVATSWRTVTVSLNLSREKIGINCRVFYLQRSTCELTIAT